jgi:AcrR family transcriptional regulator
VTPPAPRSRPSSGTASGPGKTSVPPGARRRGRPAGSAAGETRDRILTAAREEFSARGYDRTSVRSIGKAAGVDAALVHHYSGTKEQIFAAAIEVFFAPAADMPDAVTTGDRGAMGERAAGFFLRVWENPETREPLLAVVRSALTNETAAAVFRSLVGRMVLARPAGEVSAPDAEFRVQLAASHMVGLGHPALRRAARSPRVRRPGPAGPPGRADRPALPALAGRAPVAPRRPGAPAPPGKPRHRPRTFGTCPPPARAHDTT